MAKSIKGTQTEKNLLTSFDTFSHNSNLYFKLVITKRNLSYYL